MDGWSEITDGLDQRKRFEVEQQHMREGDEEAQPLDEEFIEAMEYGMPPLGVLELALIGCDVFNQHLGDS